LPLNYKNYLINIMSDKKICTCDCHKKGNAVMHFAACCDLTYEKYINEDGSIDEESYEILVDRVIYDKFMDKYEKEHALCPKCGEENHRSTLVGYAFDSSNPEEYKDLNRCTCMECGDIHTTHERKPLNS